MTKIFALLIFSFLLMNVSIAAEQKPAAVRSQDYTYNVSDDYNFNTNITDAQLEQQARELKKIEDDNNGLESKIINSSHFSSGTATKTWIPLNRPE